MCEATNFKALPGIIETSSLGNIDERYNDMEAQMDLIDSLFKKEESSETVPTHR